MTRISISYLCAGHWYWKVVSARRLFCFATMGRNVGVTRQCSEIHEIDVCKLYCVSFHVRRDVCNSTGHWKHLLRHSTGYRWGQFHLESPFQYMQWHQHLFNWSRLILPCEPAVDVFSHDQSWNFTLFLIMAKILKVKIKSEILILTKIFFWRCAYA